MPQTPQITAALPSLVVVSGTASGLGAHIAAQLIGSGVVTIGVDIAAAPEGTNSGATSPRMGFGRWSLTKLGKPIPPASDW